MTRSTGVMLTLGFLATSCLVYARTAGVQAIRLKIHLHDMANTPSHTLAEAERAAASVLASAGVEVAWTRGSADSEEANTIDQTAGASVRQQAADTRGYLVVRIVKGFPARALPSALGFSLPDAKSGAHVTVFYDRIESLSEAGAIGVSALLGNAMAHEIGHVLIGTVQHSPDGIMKARWGKPDYKRAAMGYLGFNGSQRAAIRERLQIRLAAND